MLGLPFATESLTAVAALCCGSALRADFFLKTMLEAADDGTVFFFLLKNGLLRMLLKHGFLFVM